MRDRQRLPARPSLPFVLLSLLLGALWLAGGASRGDVVGQLIVRAVAWGALVAAALVAPRPRLRDARWTTFLVVAALILVLVQLIPLPPSVWQALPGRELMVEAARLGGGAQPWRPLSIVPGSTVNAASSLVVPIVTLLLVLALTPAERRRMPAFALILVVAATVVGMLQFSGAGFDNPLLNDTPGEVSGMFANRNHFALFAAMGCLLAPAWAFADDRRPQWRAPAALALVLLFVLIILASGSRAGMILGLVAVVAGLLLARRGIRRELRRWPRWVFLALVAGVVAAVAAVVLVVVAADRAVSIDRALAIDAGHDMRTRGLPTVWAMIVRYFPAGTGAGSFDPLFRIAEPFALLKLTYFNHAHNDFLEIALDTGLPGLLLLASALGWWVVAGARAWRAPAALPRLGAAMLLLVVIASLFDYPARTPMIMAMMVLAATWLEMPGDDAGRSALPGKDQHL